MWEKLTKIEICEMFWWIIEILCLGYPSPMEKFEKSKNEKLNVLMNVNFFDVPFSTKGILFI